MIRSSPWTFRATSMHAIRTNVIILALAQHDKILFQPKHDHGAVLAILKLLRRRCHLVVPRHSEAPRNWIFARGSERYPGHPLYFPVLISRARDTRVSAS